METSLNYTEAQNDIAFLAQRFRGILALADYLKEIESLEQFADERQKFAAYLRDFANQEQIRLDTIKASIVVVEAEAKDITDKANLQYNETVAKAKLDAETIADTVLKQLEVDKAARISEINKLKETITADTFTLDGLKTQIQAATQQLQTVRNELEKLRNSF